MKGTRILKLILDLLSGVRPRGFGEVCTVDASVAVLVWTLLVRALCI